VNLGEFDEEINGINLSKLFSAYGPSTVVDPVKSLKRLSPKNRSAGFNMRLLGEEESNEDEEEPDFSNFEEPIIIRLMAGMFGQKKSVQEGLEMLPEISVDKIGKELKSLKFQEMARREKEKREQSQWELH
jgi:hypothetical protein